jgi:predicted nuclease of restriction endonuclease-like (RecB) superfamily
MSQTVVELACNPSIMKAETGRSLRPRPAWSTEQIPGQPGLHRETLSQKNKTNKKQKTNKQKKKTKQNQKTKPNISQNVSYQDRALRVALG